MNDFFTYDFEIKKIVFATFVPANTGESVHRNRPSHGLALNLGGEKCYTFEGAPKIHLRENELIYLPKNSTYVVEALTPGDCYAINFEVSEAISFPPFSAKIKNVQEMLTSFRQAEQFWKNRRTGYHLKCKAELYRILFRLQCEHEIGYASSTQRAMLDPAVDYIHSNYTEGTVSIGFLAKLCGISEPYFRKVFLRCYGISPLHYVNRLKLERSRELILSGLYSVREASELSGFQDESYFSREFKKYFGVSPSKIFLREP